MFEEILQKLGFVSVEEQDEEAEQNEEEVEEAESEEASDGFFARMKERIPFFHRRQDEEDGESESDEDEPSDEGKSYRAEHSNVIHDDRMKRKHDGYGRDTDPVQMKIKVIHMVHLEECGKVIQWLLSKQCVLVNLENIDPKDCTRVVDMLSGAAYALSGNMHKIAHLSYLLAPKEVSIEFEKQSYVNRSQYRS